MKSLLAFAALEEKIKRTDKIQAQNKNLKQQCDDLLAALKGDEENCTLNVPSILAQALLGNYDAVKSMLSELCSINAKAIAKAEKQ